MNEIIPGREYRARGKNCVFLHDAIAPSLPPASQQVVILEDAKEGIVFCSSELLKETRKTFPDAHIYGYWQMLLASGFVGDEATLQAVYFDAKGRGQYFLRENEHSGCTGEIRDGRPLDVAGRELSLKQAVTINPLLKKINLPRNAAQSYEERLRRKDKSKRKAIALAAGCACVAVAIWQGASAYQEHEAARREALALEIQDLRDLKSKLLRERVMRVPEQQNVLASFLRLFFYWGDVDVREQGLLQKQFVASIDNEVGYASDAIAQAEELNYSYEYQPRGGGLLRWQIK